MFIQQAHAALHHQVLRTVETNAAGAIAMEPDPAAAQGIGRARRDAATGGWVLPGGIHRQFNHRQAALASIQNEMAIGSGRRGAERSSRRVGNSPAGHASRHQQEPNPKGLAE